MDLQGQRMDYALNGRVMLCTGVILFVALITVLFFHNYVRIMFRDSRRRYMRHRARQLLAISTVPGGVGGVATSATVVASKGLDSSVIKTIPTIVYAADTPVECAVCLSEFENGEKARVLPKCNHSFHVDCIDMWFFSHTNCPLCRAPVQAFVPVAETAGSESEEDIETNTSSSPSPSSSSSSMEMESCPMKKVELVGILVELPNGAPYEIGFGSDKESQRAV